MRPQLSDLASILILLEYPEPVAEGVYRKRKDDGEEIAYPHMDPQNVPENMHRAERGAQCEQVYDNKAGQGSRYLIFILKREPSVKREAKYRAAGIGYRLGNERIDPQKLEKHRINAEIQPPGRLSAAEELYELYYRDVQLFHMLIPKRATAVTTLRGAPTIRSWVRP